MPYNEGTVNKTSKKWESLKQYNKMSHVYFEKGFVTPNS